VVAQPSRRFWAGRRVLLTGHTGFKGAWAARMLAGLGAEVTGFALDPVPGSSAFAALEAGEVLHDDRRGDLRDADALREATAGADIVLHMAAQAIVSEGFRDPAGTWASNVTGTLNLLTALRGAGAAAVVVVTSDKVYRNDAGRPLVESDPLGGADPYSASKAACEILVESHRAAFDDLPPLATARAGNVIGGGDFGRDRLIPDLVRARLAGEPLALRNPSATRPFQHVLDVIAGYLLLAEALAKGDAPEAVNFGPDESALSVTDMLAHWEAANGEAVDWRPADRPGMTERPRLALDSARARTRLGWVPRLTTAEAVADTATWYRDWVGGAPMAPVADAALARWIGA
jgi:CDP-glucose 4,6-dehydratase